MDSSQLHDLHLSNNLNMDSGRPAFDCYETEVYFPSCDTLVPFKNPSDAAIARLSIQQGVSLRIVQAMLDLIVFNPSFNSREVSFKSAGGIDEVVAEYREMQVLRRASVGDEEMVSSNGATSPLAISLVVSQIKQDMVPSSPVGAIGYWSHDFMSLLENMSLVHRSWTMPAQELLFRFVFCTDRSELVRRLLQHPFCSKIRELDMTVEHMSDDDLDCFALLLLGLPSLRRLTLDVSNEGGVALADRDNICTKIYSKIAPCLPILDELLILHKEIALLEDCVQCILQEGSGAVPFILKNCSIFDDYTDAFRSEMLLSPAHLHTTVHHEALHVPSTCQVPNSRNIAKRSFTVRSRNNQRLARLFNAGGVFRDFLPEISHFTFNFSSPISKDVIAFRAFLAGFLGECTSLAHMNVFVTDSSSQEMPYILFSSISVPLQVLNIYYSCPVDSNAQNRASGLEHVVQTMRDREAGSSPERIEVTFCDNFNVAFRRALQQEVVEMALPEYLDPVSRMCHELDIDLVCKIVK